MSLYCGACSLAAVHEGNSQPGLLEREENPTLADDLRVDAAEGLLHLAYQPQVDLYSGRLIGGEALIRWTHHRRGEVSPARLINVAESAGIIHNLGAWILRRVCRDVAEWREAGILDSPVAVNLSPVQLSAPQAASAILGPFLASGLPPGSLMVEITENFPLQHSDCVLAALNELAAAGLPVVLDDFGTGYSSLVHLRRYPVSWIKVDASFVQGLGRIAADEEIVIAVLGLARALGIKVIAEGVETAEQAAFLRAHGCDGAQGYFFGRPMSAHDFGQWLQSHPANSRAAAHSM